MHLRQCHLVSFGWFPKQKELYTGCIRVFIKQMKVCLKYGYSIIINLRIIFFIHIFMITCLHDLYYDWSIIYLLIYNIRKLARNWDWVRCHPVCLAFTAGASKWWTSLQTIQLSLSLCRCTSCFIWPECHHSQGIYIVNCCILLVLQLTIFYGELFFKQLHFIFFTLSTF